MKLDITKEWLEKRATAEGDHEIGVGGNRTTMTLNLTDEEIAELEQLIDPRGAALRKAAAEVIRCRHDPYGNFAAAMRDLEAALGPSPSPNVVAAWRYRYEPHLTWHVAEFVDQLPRKELFPLLQIEALYAEPPAPEPQMTGPQDISTAPKMTDVLVWWPIVQLDEDGEPTEQVVDGRWIISEDQGGYWIEPDVMNAIGDHLGDDFTYAAQPSHWMPLPAQLFVAEEGQPNA